LGDLGRRRCFAAVLQAALAAENKRCRRIISGPALAENAAGWTVRPESSADYAAVLDALREAGVPRLPLSTPGA